MFKRDSAESAEKSQRHGRLSRRGTVECVYIVDVDCEL